MNESLPKIYSETGTVVAVSLQRNLIYPMKYYEARGKKHMLWECSGKADPDRKILRRNDSEICFEALWTLSRQDNSCPGNREYERH